MPTNAAATGFWTAMPSGSRSNNARQGRALLQGFFANNDATPLNGTRSGVYPTTWDVANTRFTDLLVTVTSGLTMSVAPGTGVAHRSGQGPYEGWLLSAASITCDAAPVSSARNDIVVMRWYDTSLGVGDTSPTGDPCRIEIIPGTPGAGDPVTWNSLNVITSFPPSAPGGGIGIPLARAQVSTSGVITLTRLRRSAGIPGAVRALLEGDTDNGGRPGDQRYNPATDTFEVMKSDGTWQKIRPGADVGGEWRDARTTPALAGTGPTKLAFATVATAPNGLTFNGSDTWTVQTDGTYNTLCQLRSTAAVNGGVAMGATTYADGTHILPFLGFTGGPDYGVSGPAKLVAGQQFCFWFYNNGSATTINNTLRNARVNIWKQQAAA